MGFFGKNIIPEKLNICLVTRKFPYPGREDDETYLWPIARGLSNRGHDVVVLSWQNPRQRAEVVSGRVKAYFLGEGRKKVSRSHFPQLVYDKFKELHAAKPFHIVHSLDESAALIAKERKQHRVIVTYDVSATQMSQIFSILSMAQDTLGGLLSTGVAMFYKFLTTFFTSDRKLLQNADGVFASTELQKIMLERYYLYPDLKTFVVPYGMDHLETKINTPSEDLRVQLQLPSAGQNVLTYTDMSELNEVTHLLRAFQKVVVKRPNSRLIIMGNGPLKSQIEFETLSLALGSKVIFTGLIPTEKIVDYIALADVYVNLSSRPSGFEPAMLEAMVQKKVVIASEFSPMATILEDGLDGFLVRPADVKTLMELMAALFSGDFKSRNGNKTAQEIGELARLKVLDLFDVDKMVDKMLAAFQRILHISGRKLHYSPTVNAPGPQVQA